MAVLIGKYEFDGPYNNISDLQERQGLYVVLHCDGEDYELIHAAQADNIRECIEVSRLGSSATFGTVLFAACYTPGCRVQERRMMVEDILAEMDDQGNQECDIRLLARTGS
jgi:hypothetical protein